MKWLIAEPVSSDIRKELGLPMDGWRDVILGVEGVKVINENHLSMTIECKEDVAEHLQTLISGLLFVEK